MPPCALGSDGAGPSASDRERVKESTPSKLPSISQAQLAEHCTPDDLWVNIDGKVYDLTKWAESHPGGHHLIVNAAGTDASGVFHAFHTNHGTGGRALKMLKYLPHVANMEYRSPTKLEMAFAELRERVDQEGLYETDYSFYLKLGIWLNFLLLMTIWLVLRASTVSGVMIAALVFGIFLQQCAFVGHDTAHNGITHDRKTDMLIGVIAGPLLTGLSTAWWKHSHNAHHVVTNSTSHDPDIQHMPVMAITDKFWKEGGGTFSHYHNFFFRFDSAAKFLISYQQYLFLPIMSVARWNLYVQGLLLLLNPKIKVENRFLELVAMSIYWTWVGALVSFLPSWQLRALFLVFSHNVTAILHIQICLSHFSMPTYEGKEFPAPVGEQFIRQQCYTSMDVATDWYDDWFHGGLQFQLAHHIFPRVPRHNLRRVQKMLQRLCLEHGVEYRITRWWDGFFAILSTLEATALKARESKVVDLGESDLWKAMCAEG